MNYIEQNLSQHLTELFEKHLNDHEKKFGKPVPDRSVFLDVPWPKNVLQQVMSAYHQRNSFMGSLSRSRTSLNLLSTSNTPDMERRRSISPNRAKSVMSNTTPKRGKLTKASRYASTSNLNLGSEKTSGFSVFSGSEEKRRGPIMAYGNEVPMSLDRKVKRIEEEPRKSLDRSKPVEKGVKDQRLYRQSLSTQMMKTTEDIPPMKRSISQQSLKKDVAMEAVMIDISSMEENKYDTMKSTSTFATISSHDSDIDIDGITSQYFSRWGPVRGSNSYSNSVDIPVSQLSTLNIRKSIMSNKSNDKEDSVV